MRPIAVLTSRVTQIALSLAVLWAVFPTVTQVVARSPFRPRSVVELSPGITFSSGTMRTGKSGLQQSVRVATISPNHPSVRLRMVLSNDSVIEKELPTEMANRTSVPGMVAVVATNGDMGTRDRVDAYAAPHSMAVSGGELLVAQACTRPTLGIDSAGGARIGDVRVHVTIREPGRRVARQVHRVNTHRDDTKVVLYTSRFAASTMTAPGGVEVTISLPDLLRPNGVQDVQVLEVRQGTGNSPLWPGMAVLSVFGPKSGWVSRLQPGQMLRLETTVVHEVDHPCGGVIEAAPGWGDTLEALGGNYFTLRDWAVVAPSRDAHPNTAAADPRTNVGVTADGRVLMVTVDGRQPGYSIGMRLRQMGRLMSSLGAVSAINLDGGGSTVMARRSPRNGRFTIVNRPSDGIERPASEALIAFRYGY